MVSIPDRAEFFQDVQGSGQDLRRCHPRAQLNGNLDMIRGAFSRTSVYGEEEYKRYRTPQQHALIKLKLDLCKVETGKWASADHHVRCFHRTHLLRGSGRSSSVPWFLCSSLSARLREPP